MERVLKGKKRMTLIFWVLVIAIGFLIGSAYHKITGLLHEEMQVKAENMAYNSMTHMQMALEGDLEKLDTYTAHMKNQSFEEVVDYSRESLLAGSTYFDVEYVVDPDGMAYVDGKAQYVVGDRDYFKTGLVSSYPFISSPYVNLYTGERSVSMVAPVRNEKGNLICLYVADISLEHLAQNFSGRIFRGEGSCMICDRFGNIMVESENSDISKKYENIKEIFGENEAEAVEAVKNVANAVYLRKSFFSETAGYGLHYIPFEVGKQSGWVCVSFVPESYLNQNTQTVVSFLVLIGVGCCVLLFFFYICLKIVSRSDLELMEKLAYRDELTGLWNQLYLANKGPEFLELGGVTALCYFDINNFNVINDLYGRSSGDDMIKLTGEKLAALVEKNELGARIGADHFVCLKKAENEQQLEAKLNQMFDSLQETIQSAGYTFGLNLAFGAYILKPGEKDVKEALKFADLARKTGKKNGVERITYFDRGMEARQRETVAREVEMKNALNERRIVPFFQPQIRLFDRTVIGAEALARWVDADGTVHYPAEFIPYYEENGLIRRMEFQMLEQICRIKREWNKGLEFADMKVAVNLSRRVISAPDFVERFLELTELYRIGSKDLELEITETVYMGELGYVNKNIRELRKAGYSFSMDDFGAGYSSLNALTALELDQIKLDRDFLKEGSVEERAILKVVIAMAKELGAEVLCEGVENEEQEAMLKDMSCDCAQGYLYAKPISRDEFEKWRRSF